jgi:molybdenum cofactor synthesis domain-containing protein
LSSEEMHMCSEQEDRQFACQTTRTIPVEQAVGMVLAHDVTEIRKDEFKGRAFKKGHVVQSEDIPRLQRIGKEHLFVLTLKDDEIHEDDAAMALAQALMGDGVIMQDAPREGKVNLIAEKDGLLRIDREALLQFNMLGEVLCTTLHDHTVVGKGQVLAGTKAVPLVVKRAIVDEAVSISNRVRSSGSSGIVSVREMRKPKAGVVITGNEVYHGRIKDSFAPVIAKKIEALGGEIIGTYFAPDDRDFIQKRLQELLDAGADLLITTGGMSVDPDDVTRFAIESLGAIDVTYGSPVLPGAMVLVGYLSNSECGIRNAELTKSETFGTSEKSAIRNSQSEMMVPILGIPACGMYHKTTIVDLLLPRLLAGEKIGRRELAELGHGGLCLHCKECRYPICPFGK